MKYTDYDAFREATGLIDDDEKLKTIGATAFVGAPQNGGFDTEFLSKLPAFCEMHPQYHIATLTSDSDETENCELERRAEAFGLDWENLTDDEQEEFREKEEMFATTIDNRIRIVNRMNYYLCDGDADPELFLEEIND